MKNHSWLEVGSFLEQICSREAVLMGDRETVLLRPRS